MVDLASDAASEFHRCATQRVQALKLHFGDNVRHFQPRQVAHCVPTGVSRTFQPTLMMPRMVSSIVGVSGSLGRQASVGAVGDQGPTMFVRHVASLIRGISSFSPRIGHTAPNEWVDRRPLMVDSLGLNLSWPSDR
jgi:hypothetical protein